MANFPFWRGNLWRQFMNIQQIREARELYGIEGWGGGYFST